MSTVRVESRTREISFDEVVALESERAKKEVGGVDLITPTDEYTGGSEPSFQPLWDYLRKHQKDRCEWCETREKDTVYTSGGCIFDEQGTGKTLSMLSWVFRCFVTKGLDSQKTLLILKDSCFDAWTTDIQKAVNLTGVSVTTCHVTRFTSQDDISEADFVLVTPEMLATIWRRRRDNNRAGEERFMSTKKTKEKDALKRPPVLKEIDRAIYAIRFARVISDEADLMRGGKKTDLFPSAMAIRARSRWVLTGTPIHTKLANLDVLFQAIGVKEEMIMRGREAIKRAVMVRKTQEELAAEDPSMKLELLQRNVLIEDFRTEEERSLYESLYNKAEEQARMVAKMAKRNRTDTNVFISRILRCRQSALSPILMCHGAVRAGIEVDEMDEEARNLYRKIRETACMGLEATKIQMAVEFAKKYAKDERIIFFSEWTSALTLLKQALRANGFQKVAYYTGEMNSAEKSAELARVRADPEIRIMLISLRAGGVSLNLTEFSRVGFLEPYYDPQDEEQAIYRTYRIGQTKSVKVTWFLIADTIETRIREIADERLRQSRSVLSGGQVRVSNINSINTFLSQYARTGGRHSGERGTGSSISGSPARTGDIGWNQAELDRLARSFQSGSGWGGFGQVPGHLRKTEKRAFDEEADREEERAKKMQKVAEHQGQGAILHEWLRKRPNYVTLDPHQQLYKSVLTIESDMAWTPENGAGGLYRVGTSSPPSPTKGKSTLGPLKRSFKFNFNPEMINAACILTYPTKKDFMKAVTSVDGLKESIRFFHPVKVVFDRLDACKDAPEMPCHAIYFKEEQEMLVLDPKKLLKIIK